MRDAPLPAPHVCSRLLGNPRVEPVVTPGRRVRRTCCARSHANAHRGRVFDDPFHARRIMNGKGLILTVLVVAGLGLAVSGVVLLGILDQDDPGALDPVTGADLRETEVAPGPAEPLIEPPGIETRGFDPAAENPDEVAVSESESGIQVWGRVQGPDEQPVLGARV